MTESQAETPLINGRVAQLLSSREVVINVGAEHGVRKGMHFRILAESPLEVTDPATQEVLDTIDREKTRVEAVEVRARITICRTFRTIRTGGISFSTALFGDAPTRPETFRLEDSSLPPPLPESESYVKRNDRVEEIRDTSGR